ncbi:MAG: hypothetical protein VZR14_08025, partial [Hallerella sp.]|nr:hypothetical protein [Hallerella sp.]
MALLASFARERQNREFSINLFLAGNFSAKQHAGVAFENHVVIGRKVSAAVRIVGDFIGLLSDELFVSLGHGVVG